jgi:serine/threonine protein kinase
MDGLYVSYDEMISRSTFVHPFISNPVPDSTVEVRDDKIKIRVQLSANSDPVYVSTYLFEEIDQTKRTGYAKLNVTIKPKKVFVKISELAAVMRYDEKQVAVQAHVGNLKLLFGAIKTSVFTGQLEWTSSISRILTESIIALGVSNTVISADKLRAMIDWCHKHAEENTKALQDVRAINPYTPNVTLKPSVTGLTHILEFRGDNDILVRWKKQKGNISAAFRLRKLLNLFTGTLIDRLERVHERSQGHYLHSIVYDDQFAIELDVMSRIADVRGVVRFLRKPEHVVKRKTIVNLSLTKLSLHKAVEIHKSYLYVENLVGVSLQTKIASIPSLSYRECLSYLLHMTIALEDLHKAGVLHRDLKDSNIKLGTNEEGVLVPTITGFESADIVGRLQSLNKGAHFMLPPEIIYHAHVFDSKKTKDTLFGKSDIYALGVLAFQMLTTHLPSLSESFNNELYYMVRDRNGSYAESLLREKMYKCDGPYISLEIRELILLMLDPNPNRRPTLEVIKNKLIQVLKY